MEKEKKKDKKKVRKSHHLKPPGTCGPGQPGLSPEQSSGQPWQPGLPVCVHPSRGGQPPEQLFTLQRQKSRSNSETKTCPSQHWSFHLCSVLPASVSPPGACTSLLAPGPEACLPCPTGQETSSHPKMLLPRWLHYPFEFLLLVYHFGTHGRQEEAGVPS